MSSEGELGVDDLDVADRVDAAGDVDHVVVLEAAHDVPMASVSRMLARNWFARPSPFEAPGNQAGDVDELDDGGLDLLRPAISVRISARRGSAPRRRRRWASMVQKVVLGLDAGLGQRVEEGRLADVGSAIPGIRPGRESFIVRGAAPPHRATALIRYGKPEIVPCPGLKRAQGGPCADCGLGVCAAELQSVFLAE